jgi:hypothetical protein
MSADLREGYCHHCGKYRLLSRLSALCQECSAAWRRPGW